MKNIAGFALLVALAACGGSTMTSEPDPVEPERPVPCTFPNETCAERVEIATARYLPVYSTHLLSEGHAGVTRGLIVIHGNTRDADTYFETGVLAATSSRFPAMEEIVVAGHSAGGQVVHRYAATTEHTATDSGVAFRYVVTNPSTYLYLGPRREDAEGGFTVPDTGCDDYDEWHYGLQDRNSYADRLEADSIRAQLARHDVRILLGDADTTSASLDQSCGANLQGPRRYHRGRTLVRFMDELYAGHAHREMIVPGVGHSSRSMWLSGVGAGALFGN